MEYLIFLKIESHHSSANDRAITFSPRAIDFQIMFLAGLEGVPLSKAYS
jgi:hypothetical protein